MKKSPSQNFYEDIDKHSRKRHCCTCQTMLIAFGILFVIGVILIWWLFRAISAKELAPVRKNFPSAESLASYKQKVADLAAQILLSQEAGGGQNLSLTITEQELTSALAEQQDKLTYKSIKIRDTSVAITPENLEVYGQLVEPLESQIKITLLPKVKDGHLEAQVKSLEAGRVKLPKFLVGELNQLVAKTIEDLVTQGSITEIKTVELSDGQLTITGQVRQD